MQEEYIKRINTVLSFIDKNLDAELSLQSISEIACYSPFHLHRLFKTITTETLNTHITRKRIERAAMMLMHNKDCSITEISFKYGFTSNAVFSRAFKKIYGQSPSEFRKSNLNTFSKISKVDSKIGKVNYITREYICNVTNLKNWVKLNSTIEIIELRKMHLVYLTQIGQNGIDKTFQRIFKWATPRGLFANGNAHLCRVFHDSFKVTDPEKVRMSIGVRTNQLATVNGDVGLTTMEKEKAIVGHFIIEPKEFEKAWHGLFIWMNENGYQKADSFPFEIYHNDYNEHPEKKCVVELCIPID